MARAVERDKMLPRDLASAIEVLADPAIARETRVNVALKVFHAGAQDVRLSVLVPLASTLIARDRQVQARDMTETEAERSTMWLTMREAAEQRVATLMAAEAAKQERAGVGGFGVAACPVLRDSLDLVQTSRC